MSKSTAAPKKRPLPKTGDEKANVYKIVRSILSKYSPPLTPISDTDRHYEILSKKPVEFMGVKRPGMYFASTKIQGSFVGLYLMHVYMRPQMLQDISPRLLTTLKGKTCFHIKKIDEELIKEIENAVEQGFKLYQHLGLI
jgi:hypothetical protein